MKPEFKKLWAVEWEESEQGWGVRPDGFSFHRSPENANQYVQDIYSKYPYKVPSDYSRACSNPTLIEVSDELYTRVMQSTQLGVRLWKNNIESYKTFTLQA